MANEGNLKKFGSEREPREAGRKGGIASGESRRKKRDMKSAAKLLLGMDIADQNISNTMMAFGFSEEDLTNQMAMLVSVWKEAMRGNIRAAEFLRDTAGYNQDNVLKRQQFLYEKKKDAGESSELEDLTESEMEIYGRSPGGAVDSSYSQRKEKAEDPL